MGHDVTGQDIAFRQKETSKNENATPNVVARESVTRQTKTLSTSRLRWRRRYQDRVMRMGQLENMWVSDRPGPTTSIHGVGERR